MRKLPGSPLLQAPHDTGEGARVAVQGGGGAATGLEWHSRRTAGMGLGFPGVFLTSWGWSSLVRNRCPALPRSLNEVLAAHMSSRKKGPLHDHVKECLGGVMAGPPSLQGHLYGL